MCWRGKILYELFSQTKFLHNIRRKEDKQMIAQINVWHWNFSIMSAATFFLLIPRLFCPLLRTLRCLACHYLFYSKTLNMPTIKSHKFL